MWRHDPAWQSLQVLPRPGYRTYYFRRGTTIGVENGGGHCHWGCFGSQKDFEMVKPRWKFPASEERWTNAWRIILGVIFNAFDYQRLWWHNNRCRKREGTTIGIWASFLKINFENWKPRRKCPKSEEQWTNVGRIIFGMIFNAFYFHLVGAQQPASKLGGHDLWCLGVLPQKNLWKLEAQKGNSQHLRNNEHMLGE